MTDNSLATDEEVEAALDEAGSGWGMHLSKDNKRYLMREALNAASRIRAETAKTCPGADDPEERCPKHPKDCTCWQVDLDHPTVKQRAETAKNSGEVVAWPEDETKLAEEAEKFGAQVSWANEPDDFHHLIEFTPPNLLKMLRATPANSRAKNGGEAVAWETHDIQIDGSPVRTFSKMEAEDWIAKGRRISRYFYATPANSRAEAIGVKLLEWKAVRKAVIGADGYEITDMSAGNKQGWRGSFPGENTYRWFSTIEDAQDAAQGHYLRALLQQEGE